MEMDEEPAKAKVHAMVRVKATDVATDKVRDNVMAPAKANKLFMAAIS